MERASLKSDLVTIIRLIAEGDKAIARHRELVEVLEGDPETSSDNLQRARDVLTSMEEMQTRRITNRDTIRRLAGDDRIDRE